MKKRIFFTLIILFGTITHLYSNDVRITYPRGGFTTKQVQLIKGTAPVRIRRATLLVNGIPQDVPVINGEFKIRVVVAPGINVVEFLAAGRTDRISFFAKVPRRDIKMVLTWDSGRFVDLWVVDPKGYKCYWANTSTPTGGNITANDATGFGPQIYTMENAMPGHYSIQVQYYSKANAPVSRVKLYIILYEGTPKERRETYYFIMTRERQVYHITDLHIKPEM
ncbi:MAG: DUF2135 domain-containing protein [bacterium]|nr:DUF2135 domain-containing protein [bacterium]